MNVQNGYTKVVVLGAGGFVGINLVKKLVESGYEVICFDLHPCQHWPAHVKVILGDFSLLPEELMSELNNAIVFHLISSCRPSINTSNAQQEIGNDLLNTIHYLERSLSKNLRWVFLSSGGTVYGQTELERIPESYPCSPICTYGAVKLSVESYFSIYHKIHNTDFVVARLANPYGAWQWPDRGQGIVPTIINKILHSEVIEIWGTGEQIRDYIHIEDAINGLLILAQFGRSGEVYNVGTGTGLSLNSVVSKISKVVCSVPILHYMPSRLSDVSKNILDCSKIKNNFGWSHEITFEDGVFSTVQWIHEFCRS